MNLSSIFESILNESKMDDLKATGSVPEDTFNQLHDNALPVKEKNATSMRWLLDRHAAGDEGVTNPANHSLVQKSMTQHGLQKAKGNLPANQKNLNQFKSISHLHDAMKPHVDAADAKVEAKDKEIVFQNDTHIIRKHTTRESISAAAKLSKSNPEYVKVNGKATWCVAADGDGGKELHNQYTQSGKHPFYTIEHTANHPDDPHKKYALLHNPERTDRGESTEFRNAAQDNDNSEEGIKRYIEDNHEIMHTDAGKFLDHTVEGHFATLKPTEYRQNNTREGQYVNWKKEGIHKTFKYGQLESVGKYVNNKKEGEHQTFEYGDLKSEGNFVNGKKHGIHTEYHSTRKISSIGNWVNGEKDGVHTDFDYDGHQMFQGAFVNGKEDGRHISHHYGGIKLHSDVMFDNGKKIGRHDTYYENGKPAVSGNWIDGKEDGHHQILTDDGKVLKSGSFKDGKKEGIHEEYINRGDVLVNHGKYVNGAREGVHLQRMDYGFQDGNKNVLFYKKFEGGVENGVRKSYHGDDGMSIPDERHLQSTVNVVKGKRQGEEKRYHQGTGKLSSSSQFVDDQKHGISQTFDFHTGDVDTFHNYKEGVLHGPSKNEEGSEVNYKDGKKNGLEIERIRGRDAPLGTIEWKDGLEHGKMITFRPNGEKHTESDYKDGKLNGSRTVFDYGGNVSSRHSYKDGEKHGDFEDIEANQTGTYKNGMLHGKLIRRFLNGKIESVKHYVNNEEQGIREQYYDTGELQHTAEMKDGNLDGAVKFYHRNGKLKSTGNFNINRKHGMFTTWNENGQKISEGNWKDGMEDGLHTDWHPDGTKSVETTWRNGEMHGMRTEWHPNGKMSWDGWMESDRRSGLHRQWYENGQLSSEQNFNATGHHVGKQTKWYENGVVGDLHHMVFDPDIKRSYHHGPQTLRHHNGNKSLEMNWNKGRPSGNYMSYHPSGNVDTEFNENNEIIRKHEDSDNVRESVNKFRRMLER